MPPDLKSSLKKAQPIVRQYVSELEARNAKLQHKIVKLEADKIERDHRIKAFEKELKKLKQPIPKIDIQTFSEGLRQQGSQTNEPTSEPAK